ncbi:MAG TPA: metal-dependent hydrolase [Gemmataceae bacterium]|nr:metal-dependent hydrolase [Gemmataceae bacterium]
MAAFKQHVTFSSVLGVGYAAALAGSGADWVHSVLAGGLCGIAGMLPDLDSPSGRPVRELFGITAIAVPLLLAYRLRRSGLEPEQLVLLAAVVYLLIRFGLSWLFKHLTVHRGMFHSIPAMLIAGEAVFLAHDSPERYGRLTLAGGIMLGFLSHLVLDEIYAVDMNGMAPRFNKAAGSALKFFSKSWAATLGTWLLLGGLTYLVGVDLGYFSPVHIQLPSSLNVQRSGLLQRIVPNSVPGTNPTGARQ